MSRDDGFAIMDVSTSIHEEPKFRRLSRRHPDLIAAAFFAYVSTMAESWRHGERVSIEDAWPSLIPYNAAVVSALRRYSLIDRRGCIGDETWEHWFGPAFARREAARAAGREGNRRRWHPDSQPRSAAIALASGADIGSGSGSDPRTVPTVPTVLTTPPPPTSGGRRKNRTNPRARGTAPRDTGDNPRANGEAPRQEREREKRAAMPESVHEILRRAAAEGQP